MVRNVLFPDNILLVAGQEAPFVYLATDKGSQEPTIGWAGLGWQEVEITFVLLLSFLHQASVSLLGQNCRMLTILESQMLLKTHLGRCWCVVHTLI